MSYKDNSILALIPARGGSKGIPKKNLAEILGFSLIALAAKTASQVGFIDKTIISTDNLEMALEATKHGAEAPFMRPPELASDSSTAIDTWKHAWISSEEHFKRRFDISVLLEPTSPMRTPEDVAKTIELLLSADNDAAVTVSRTPAHYSPHKALFISEDGYLKTFHLEGEKYSIRQKIPSFYHRNGIAYAVRRHNIIERGTIFGGKCAALVIERQVVNIDTIEDLEYARYLIQKQNNKKVTADK